MLRAQAMDLISVAQQTGEVSADAFAAAYDGAGGSLPPPHMVGVEELVQRMAITDAELNPFSGGAGAAGGPENGGASGGGGTTGSYGIVPPSPGNAGGQFRPPAIIPPAPSPPRSVVRPAAELGKSMHEAHHSWRCVFPGMSMHVGLSPRGLA